MKVYLVATSAFDAESFLQFVDARMESEVPGEKSEGHWRRTATATQAEELVEAAGRICYMSFGCGQSPRDNREYIRRLIQMGHESVLEHVSWTFVVTGVSRALTHQLVRHRVGFAFSQLSQQYHEERGPDLVEPPLLRQFPKAHAAWQHAVTAATEAYVDILNEVNQSDPNCVPELDLKEIHRLVRSTARSVLPNATATTIMVTANARSLRYFLKVRGSIPGDEEMRCLAAELLRILRNEAPAIVSDFDLSTFSDGSPVVVHRPIQDIANDRPT
jgi:thymidylate synthase (FAD)